MSFGVLSRLFDIFGDYHNSDIQDSDYEPSPHLRWKVVKNRKEEYTRHTSVVKFTDGEEKRYVWDVKDEKNGMLILNTIEDCFVPEGYNPKNYLSDPRFTYGDELSIPMCNIREFETVERVKLSKPYSYWDTKYYEIGEELAEDIPDKYLDYF